MARTRTLAELEGDVLWQADKEGTTLRNQSARVRRAINQSIAEFREAVSDAGDPWFLEKSTDSLSVGPTSPYHFAVLDLSALSPAHFKVYGFDIEVGGVWVSLEPAQFRERNDVQVQNAGGDIPRLFFEFDRSSIAYAPASNGAYEYLLWYLPVHEDLTADGDTFDGINGWEDWVTFNAVARLLLRDRDAHLERFEAERARILARVLGSSKQRQRGGAHVRGGVTRGDRRGSGRGGPFWGQAGDALNQPGTGEVGRVAIARSDGKINWHRGADQGDKLEWSGSTWVQRRGWITPDVDPNGIVDATATVQAALNSRPGACVFIPDNYQVRFNSGLTIPGFGALVGSERGNGIGPKQFTDLATKKSQLRIYGTGDFLTCFSGGGPHGNQTIANLEFYYPNQQTNATPDAYGWTIAFGANAHFGTLANLSCLNAYQFLSVASANGITVDGITGYPLSTGIYLGRVADVARFKDVHFIPSAIGAIAGSTLTTWVQDHATAFSIDGPEEFTFTDCFAYGYDNGIEFLDTDADGFRGVYGSWKAGGIDIANRCIRVREPNGLTLRGFKISDCGLVPKAGGYGVQFIDSHVPATDDERPTIYATNVSFWNAMNRAIYIVNGSYGQYYQTQGSARSYTTELARVEGHGLVQLRGVFGPSPRGSTANSGVFEDIDPRLAGV